MSHAVVGLLDDNSEQRFKDLWAQLEDRFGVGDLRHRVPWPHVSFVVAERILEGIAEIVHELAQRVEPIAFRAPSWTVFTGPSPMLPAIVRAVVRQPALDAAHSQIAPAARSRLADVSPLTEPDAWNPHITLAARDLRIQQVGPVVQWLADNDVPTWTGQITRLGLIVDDNGEHDLACVRALRGA